MSLSSRSKCVAYAVATVGKTVSGDSSTGKIIATVWN